METKRNKQWTNFPGLRGEITVTLKRQAYLNNKRLAVEVVTYEGGAEVHMPSSPRTSPKKV